MIRNKVQERDGRQSTTKTKYKCIVLYVTSGCGNHDVRIQTTARQLPSRVSNPPNQRAQCTTMTPTLIVELA